jgi:hypothetical protein
MAAGDHLLLVAGIRRGQVNHLRSAGLHTLKQLAQAPATPVPNVAAHTFETLHDQAGLQLRRRTTGALDWHALPIEPGCGFEQLPRPSPGDVIFDIEGDPFWEPARGLHFLFGLLTHDRGYQAIWAHSREGERQALEQLVDFFHERLLQHPDMHVYHYGAYEPTALKQLMGVYATREDAMDALLRREIFCDLHSVVRQGLRAGVPGYSLKEVEALPAFRRQARVTSGTRAVLAYEAWMTTRAAAQLDEITAYNEEDCRATLALRDWLVEHRPEGAAWAKPPEEEVVDDDRQKADARREALRQALLAGATETPRWLAAGLLEYHRREARPAWWWMYMRCQMSLDELVEDGESIGRLDPGNAATGEDSLEHRFSFPAQQHKLAPAMAGRPATGKGAGTIWRWTRRPALPSGGSEPIRPASDGADPAGAHPGQRAARRPRAPRRSHAGRQRPIPRARGHPGPGATTARRRVQRADPDDGPSRAARTSRRARPELSLHPGAAGHRQDVDGRADRRGSHPPRPARRRRGHEPQGDPQPARRDRPGRPRRRCAGPRPQEMQRRQRRDGVPARLGRRRR